LCFGVLGFPIRENEKPAGIWRVLARVSKKFRQESDGWRSESLARLPNEKNEGRDQSSGDQHPVLAFETQKCKTPDQKLHRSCPRFWAE
jgi:hypothetical protein